MDIIKSIIMIAPELVAEQHFFLEEMTNIPVLWSVRVICIIGGVTALLVYFKMKNKKGE